MWLFDSLTDGAKSSISVLQLALNPGDVRDVLRLRALREDNRRGGMRDVLEIQILQW